MVTIHTLSPQNEAQLVAELAADIERTWPDVAADPDEHVDLLVGARSGVDVDLLIALDLQTPRGFGRPGPGGSPQPPAVASGLIAVEIKQLDATRFERIGNQIFAFYKGHRNNRSCSDQARDAAYGIKGVAASSGFPTLFIHALAWLTQLDEAALAGADPALVGRGGWRALVAAACRQSPALPHSDERTRAGVRAVRDRLLLRRTFTPLDRFKSERVARDALLRELVGELAQHAGTATIRLAGHGGSGKTTALIMLATRLATQRQARVLILTFHQALRGDIRHILDGMPEMQALSRDYISVETATSFLLGIVAAAGGSVPRNADSTVAYDRVDAAYRQVADYLKPATGISEGAAVVAQDPARFDWDHILIDEAQDWSDAERDLLMAVYGSRRVVLADGLAQLIRRQTSCNWMLGVPKHERFVRQLGDSLRMQRNVALFANAFAQTLGFSDWRVEPRAELVGGRVVVLEGELRDGVALVHALRSAAAPGKAEPVDNLVCVPHSEIVRSGDGGRSSRLAADLCAAGDAVWDACDPLTRSGAPQGASAWRIVQYDSCRGLEGWATLLLGLDDLYANRRKHPNVAGTDRAVDPELVARRWLLIPITRAVHLLVVHVRDSASPVAALLREAVAMLPRGSIEVYAAHDGARALGGSGGVAGSGRATGPAAAG